MRLSSVALVCLLLQGAAAAEETPTEQKAAESQTEEQAADRVLAAVKAKVQEISGRTRMREASCGEVPLELIFDDGPSQALAVHFNAALHASRSKTSATG